MSEQLVYFQLQDRAPSWRCRPAAIYRGLYATGGYLDQARPAVARCLVGAVAQFDECEDDIDEATQVPVRYRRRVMAAPLDGIRPVL